MSVMGGRWIGLWSPPGLVVVSHSATVTANVTTTIEDLIDQLEARDREKVQADAAALRAAHSRQSSTPSADSGEDVSPATKSQSGPSDNLAAEK